MIGVMEVPFTVEFIPELSRLLAREFIVIHVYNEKKENLK